MAKKKVKKKITKKVAKKSNSSADVIQIILKDHKPLKQLIKVMKSSKKSHKERMKAFEDFAPLLTVHAKAEEKVVYTFMKKEVDLREDGFEGDVEHGLADQMVEEIKRTDDEDLQSARIKVLAELVEHHIEEEEEDMFPDLKKQTTAEQREKLGQLYLDKKPEVMANEVKAGSMKDRALEKYENKQLHHS